MGSLLGARAVLPGAGDETASLPAWAETQRPSFPPLILQPGDGLYFWINFSRKQIFKQPLNLSPSTARMVPAGESSQLLSCIPQHGTAPASREQPRDGDQKDETLDGKEGQAALGHQRAHSGPLQGGNMCRSDFAMGSTKLPWTGFNNVRG